MASIHGWLKLSLRPQRVVFVSPAFWWPEHWLDSLGRSCRCVGGGCALCELYPPRPAGCVAVRGFDSRRVYLLKLPAGDQDLLAQLDSMGGEWVGQVVDVALMSKDPQDGIELKLAGREPIKEVPVSRYVGAIGMRAYAQALAALGLEVQLEIA